MERDCRKNWQLGRVCPHGVGVSVPAELTETPSVKTVNVSQAGIVFGAEHPEGAARIPGYNALAPHVKTTRDPSLSLIALSGIEPTGPVMVEVPLVLNNTTFTASKMLAGWRIGFVGRYLCAGHYALAEHSRAFDILRQAGAQLVAVDAQRADDSLEFTLQVTNDIDELVTRHRLDALVSDDLNDVFHQAYLNGYPGFCELLEEGMTLRFYSARWSRDSLATLVQAYRQQVAGA